MTLTGEYTQAGAAISAKVLSGSMTLQITRAAAGAGRTEPSEAAINDERQPLALSIGSRKDNTYTVPARLNSADSAGAYMLTEIGLYARDSDDTEVLYRIYRFDHSISISPHCQLIATFYLNDTVAAGSAASVTVTPAGLMMAQDVADMISAADYTTPQEVKDLISASGYTTTQNVDSMISSAISALPIFNSAATNITCTAANLQATVNALPKIINSNTKITVSSGTYSGNLLVHNFMGSGSLTITGPTSGTVTINGYVDVFNCRLSHILLDYLTVKGSSLRATSVRDYGSAVVSIRDCHMARLEKVTVTAPTTVSGTGFFVQRSQCIFGNTSCQNRVYGIVAHMLCKILLRSMQENGLTGCTTGYALDGACTAHLPNSPYSMSSIWGCSSYLQVACSTIFYGTYITTSYGTTASNE